MNHASCYQRRHQSISTSRPPGHKPRPLITLPVRQSACHFHHQSNNTAARRGNVTISWQEVRPVEQEVMSQHPLVGRGGLNLLSRLLYPPLESNSATSWLQELQLSPKIKAATVLIYPPEVDRHDYICGAGSQVVSVTKLQNLVVESFIVHSHSSRGILASVPKNSEGLLYKTRKEWSSA